MTNQSITIFANGKINWTLDVFAKRADGYHEIASIMQCVALADVLTFSLADRGIRLTVTGPEADGVPADERNIVWKAASLLGVDGVEIVIEKKLPIQAGLGGGSSDGAAALLALNKFFRLGHNPSQLYAFAAALGADVSFFIGQSPARVTGFGEDVLPLESGPSVDIVILKPDTGVSTVEAYSALDQIPDRTSNNATANWPLSKPSNDFESVVYDLYPVVSDARAALQDAGAEGTLLCGSGAAVMGWGADPARIAKNLRRAGYKKVWITQTVQ